MDHLIISGECRSHNQAFLEQIMRMHQKEFNHAAKTTKNSEGKHGKVIFKNESDYRAFRLKSQNHAFKSPVKQ